MASSPRSLYAAEATSQRGESVSRSVHKTVKGAFGGKSKAGINAMIEGDDPDVIELRRKKALKEQECDARAREAAAVDERKQGE